MLSVDNIFTFPYRSEILILRVRYLRMTLLMK